MQVLEELLTHVQDILIEEEALWNIHGKTSDYLAMELIALGDLVAPMFIAGLNDNDTAVQLQSFITLGRIGTKGVILVKEGSTTFFPPLCLLSIHQ